MIDEPKTKAGMALRPRAAFAAFKAWLDPMLARWNRSYGLLFAAYVACLAAIFLTNHLYLAHRIYLVFVLPLALLAAFDLTYRRPTLSITPTASGSGVRLFAMGRSMIFAALAVYLIMLLVSSIVRPEGSSHLINRQFFLTLQVLSFLLITAMLVVYRPGFVTSLFLVMAPVVALSALINMIGFLSPVPLASLAEHLPQYRLMAKTVGMLEYWNATNVSITYAIFFIAAVATATSRDIRFPQRLFLALCALVLLTATLMTQARSALIAMLMGLLVIAGTASRLVMGGIAVAAGGALALAVAVPTISNAVLTRGFSERPELWSHYLAMAAERPWLGRGIWANIDTVLQGGLKVDQAHNIVLSAQIRGGALAAAAMAFAILAGLYWAARHWRKTGQVTPLAVLATMTTAGMMDYEILVTFPTWPYVTFWLPFGLCIGAEMAIRTAPAQYRASPAGMQPA